MVSEAEAIHQVVPLAAGRTLGMTIAKSCFYHGILPEVIWLPVTHGRCESKKQHVLLWDTHGKPTGTHHSKDSPP